MAMSRFARRSPISRRLLLNFARPAAQVWIFASAWRPGPMRGLRPMMRRSRPGLRRPWAMRLQNAGPLQVSWFRPCAMAKTPTRRPLSTDFPIHAQALIGKSVESGLLVGVFAIAHGLNQLTCKGPAFWSLIAQGLRKPGRDRRIIGRSPRIGPGRQALAKIQTCAAGRAKFSNNLLEIGDLRANRDIAMVLGRRADHRWTADVDVFDRRCIVGARRDGGFEGVE